MGMAASQARFLGLTARKTNVEYEGQQVNQQRTVLSNESAGLFNQMLTLQVPTPPSATDYYNTRYVLITLLLNTLKLNAEVILQALLPRVRPCSLIIKLLRKYI